MLCRAKCLQVLHVADVCFVFTPTDRLVPLYSACPLSQLQVVQWDAFGRVGMALGSNIQTIFY